MGKATFKVKQRVRTTKLFRDFFNNEKSGGLILIACTVVSLLIANSSFSNNYHHFWQSMFIGHSIEYWVNDGLMTIFFLLVGLELEREIYIGELSKLKDALLPVIGAVGGMIVPAGIFLWLNYGTHTQSGAGIPMATDIAFALGVLSLLGKRVPVSLKIFLTALAVIDDLGAILVIAIFYTQTLLWANLLIALVILAGLFLLNRLKVTSLVPYLLGGTVMWYFMLHSGVHATITGVLLAFVIPFGKGDEKSTSYVLQQFLHKPVAFIILPIFALTNTAITLGGNTASILTEHYSLGVAAGLVLGKPIGIFLFTFLAAAVGICKLPTDLQWKHILGAGMLGGIGFTMSIFITLLAYNNTTVIDNTKLTILLSSVTASIIGLTALNFWLKTELLLKKQH